MNKLITVGKVKIEVENRELHNFMEMYIPYWNRSFLDWGIAYGTKTSKGIYKPIEKFTTCRTYLNEYLYFRDHPEYFCIKPISSGRKVNYDRTNIIFYRNRHENITTLTRKMRKYIWEREEKIGLPKTRVHLVEDVVRGLTFYVFVGSKEWQSNLWKLSMYTRYLKKVIYDTEEYWKELVANEEILLPKVKGFYEEIIKTGNTSFDQTQVHNYSGYYSIVTGYNRNMYKLLFEKEWTPPSINW